MTAERSLLPDILRESPTRVIFGEGRLAEIGSLAAQEGAKRILLVTDPGIVGAGHVERACASLGRIGLAVVVFDGAAENPTMKHVTAGVALARQEGIDFLIGLGGGSSMDCAKGINLILTNGGEMRDYWGVNKTHVPLLPSILIPTTAGTGSEAQSYALITDPQTHQKMACGDTRSPLTGGLRPRVAILDPELTMTQPRPVAAATGIDAIAHAIETSGTTKRNETSLKFSQEAWRKLDGAYERAVSDPSDDSARSDMLLGAHLAGAGIEHSMLGAAHACANPLTMRFGIVHGVAVGVMLPHVIRFNGAAGENPYQSLGPKAENLAGRVEEMLVAGPLPRRLSDLGIPTKALEHLAALAAQQWTATFNPRTVGKEELFRIYQMAM